MVRGHLRPNGLAAAGWVLRAKAAGRVNEDAYLVGKYAIGLAERRHLVGLPRLAMCR